VILAATGSLIHLDGVTGVLWLQKVATSNAVGYWHTSTNDVVALVVGIERVEHQG